MNNPAKAKSVNDRLKPVFHGACIASFKPLSKDRLQRMPIIQACSCKPEGDSKAMWKSTGYQFVDELKAISFR
ncbi:unnamed protein product [Tuwongella immobilis]|uniref:Uncharacterized protein n=1 Tax=Tuwongella immobilis TaxID=692036 RepID=A0A6C2YJB0_9BACT|nr:unnamed protein product [Tuwongella immobilis]VTR99032.1 unnamed protein product [Tuwongella immobilis]